MILESDDGMILTGENRKTRTKPVPVPLCPPQIGSGCQSPAFHRGGIGWCPGQSMWDLWRKKWHWDRFFSGFFFFSLSLSFHRVSVLVYHPGDEQYARWWPQFRDLSLIPLTCKTRMTLTCFLELPVSKIGFLMRFVLNFRYLYSLSNCRQ
jgi:hypothetical protein